MNKFFFKIAFQPSTIISSLFFATVGSAATFNLSGNYRFGANLFSNLDMQSGVLAGAGGTSSFLEHRFMLNPDVLIDDHFTVKSSLNFSQGNRSENSLPADFGSALDSSASGNTNPNSLVLRKLYLEWASDWGILRSGRMAKSWGLGLWFDPGTDVLNDSASISDRINFQALLGNLNLNFAYEKGAEAAINNDADDIDTYEFSMDYINPESLFNVGILYQRSVVTGGAVSELNSSNGFSLYAKKRIDAIQLGGELVSIAQESKAASLGFLAQFDYVPGSWSWGLDLGYASASSSSNFSFHPNYKPFLILFRQNAGPSSDPTSVRGGADANTSVGSTINNSSGSGALLAKAEASYTFERARYVMSLVAGYAQYARNPAGSKNLGFETDFILSQKWYENFKMHYGLGAFIPGKAFAAAPQIAWGFQIRGALTF